MIILAIALGCVDKGDEYSLEPLTDAQNYSFSSVISADPQVVAPGDVTVDWSGLDPDLLGRDTDPATQVDHIQIVRFGSNTVDEVLGALNEDALPATWITGYITYENESDATSALASDFDFLGAVIDPEAEIYAGPTYMMNAEDYEVVGYRGLGFFVVDEGSANTVVELSSASASLDYTVDLQGAERALVGEADSHYADWTGLTTDRGGQEMRLSELDQLMLAWYEEDLSELEADFLNLEGMADELYQQDIVGLAGFELTELITTDGTPFSGFSADGTWVLALRCTACVNPAPPYLAVLEYR